MSNRTHRISAVFRTLALAGTLALASAACDGETTVTAQFHDDFTQVVDAPDLTTLIIKDTTSPAHQPAACTSDADCATGNACDIGICAQGGRCAVSRLSHCSPGELASGAYRGPVTLEAATAFGDQSTCTGEVHLEVDPAATPQVWGTVDCAFDGAIAEFMPTRFEVMGVISGASINAELSAGPRLAIPMAAVLQGQRVLAQIEGDGHPVFAPVRVKGGFDIAPVPAGTVDACAALPRCRQVGTSLIIQQGSGDPVVLGGEWIAFGAGSIYAPGTVELSTAAGPMVLTTEGLEVTCGASLTFDGDVVMPMQSDVVYGWPGQTLSSFEHRGELSVVRGDLLDSEDTPADPCSAHVVIRESSREAALEMVIDPSTPRLHVGYQCLGDCQSVASNAFGMANASDYHWEALHPLNGAPGRTVAGHIYRSGDVSVPVAPAMGLDIRVDGALVMDVGGQLKRAAELAEFVLADELEGTDLDELLGGTVVAANGESMRIATRDDIDGAELSIAEGSVLIEQSIVRFAGVGLAISGSLSALGGADLAGSDIEVLDGREVQGILSDAGLRLMVRGRIRAGQLTYEDATITVEGDELRMVAHGPAAAPCKACAQ